MIRIMTVAVGFHHLIVVALYVHVVCTHYYCDHGTALVELRSLFADFSPRRPGFVPGLVPGLVYVKFISDIVVLGYYLRIIQFLPVFIISSMLHIDICIGSGMESGPVSGRSSHSSVTVQIADGNNNISDLFSVN